MNESSTTSLQAEQKLRDAVEELYSAFSDIPKPRQISDPSLHYYSPEQEEAMKTKTLREFTPEEMEDYAWHSFFVVGQQEQATLYWLPRLLDILCRPRAPWRLNTDAPLLRTPVFDFDFILRQMAEAHWKSWPKNKQKSFCRWCHAWWEAMLGYHTKDDQAWHCCSVDSPDNRDAARFIIVIAEAGYDITGFLSNWRSREDLSAIRELVKLVEEIGGQNAKDVRTFSGRAVQGYQPELQLVAWLASQDTVMQLERTRDRAVDEAITGTDEAAIAEAQCAEDRINFVLQLLLFLRSIELPPMPDAKALVSLDCD